MSERLDEIKARAEAATEGPWTGNNGDGYGAYYVDNPTGRTVARCDYGPYEGSRDAEFIAHARTDVPDLVAAVEAVLALRPLANTYRTLDEWEEGYNEALAHAKHKIRFWLGETT